VSKTHFQSAACKKLHHPGAKTNAQKKWAVKTRPFGREASIVAPPEPLSIKIR
jgi:hypothetical protein